jgi:hypothetical protein
MGESVNQDSWWDNPMKGMEAKIKKQAPRNVLMSDIANYLTHTGEKVAKSFMDPIREDVSYVRGRKNWSKTVEDVNCVYSKKFENIRSVLISKANVERCVGEIKSYLKKMGLSEELKKGDRLGMVLFLADIPVFVLERDEKTYLIFTSGLKLPKNRDYMRVQKRTAFATQMAKFIKAHTPKDVGIAGELEKSGMIQHVEQRLIMGDDVNFRNSPKYIKGSRSEGMFNNGDLIEVVRDEGDWLLIKHPDKAKGLAYVSSEYVYKMEEVDMPGENGHSYWDNNPDFFKENFKIKKEQVKVKVGGKSEKIQLRRDAGLTFYVVQKGDTLDSIWEKLSSLEEFSYLREKKCRVKKGDGRNIGALNITRKEVLKYAKSDKLFLIPVPLSLKQREVSEKQLMKYFNQSISEMKDHEIYGKKVKALVKKIGKKELLKIMLAYAYSETTPLEGDAPVGFFGFNRWEPATTMNRKKEKVFRTASFSFTCFHVFMEKYHRTDKKTKKTRIENSPGLKARFVLGMTEGQINHPVNAGKLFFGYWFEKAGKSYLNYFPLKEGSDAHFKKCAGKYNGDGAKYYPKLKKNYGRASKVVDELMK